VPLDKLSEIIPEKLKEVRDGLYNKALENRENRTYKCTTMDEIAKALEENGDGFVKAMWCGDEECEDKVKEITGVGSRCIPFDQEELSDVCVCCGKPAKKMLYWGKAY
jgi:prolyl-tRNA synthetase